ncbi:MAG TPA: PqqD family protein [Bryobacteraceae bacterium]|nr:PqqD family protein [Bryobacteraceae bacterium]
MFKLGRFARQIGEISETRDSFTVASGVQASVHDDGVVLLHIPTGKVFQANHTGARIWQHLSSGMQPGVIATEISRHYGVPQDLATRDIASFLTALEQHGFVTRTGRFQS